MAFYHTGAPPQMRRFAAAGPELFRIAVAGQDLRRAAHRALERLVETDATDLPDRLARAVEEAPLRDPAEFAVTPYDGACQRLLAANLAGESVEHGQAGPRECPRVEVDLAQIVFQREPN